jgi:hypothetical protein
MKTSGIGFIRLGLRSPMKTAHGGRIPLTVFGG